MPLFLHWQAVHAINQSTFYKMSMYKERSLAQNKSSLILKIFYAKLKLNNYLQLTQCTNKKKV